MMSQASTSSKPPPRAKPLTAAIIGLCKSKRAVMPPKPPRTPFIPARTVLLPCSAWYFRSLPAEKARSPAPVRIATQASSSAAKSLNTESSSWLVGGWIAFMRSGRLRVTSQT